MDIFKAKQQRGFILVMVLFFLLMIALMALSMLNATHLALRMSQNYATTTQQFWAAEAGLNLAEVQLSHLNDTGYLQDSFSYAGYHVQYKVKRFGLPICNDQGLIYCYWITVTAKQAQQKPLVLQSTYFKKINKKCEKNTEKPITEGRSSWREIK